MCIARPFGPGFDPLAPLNFQHTAGMAGIIRPNGRRSIYNRLLIVAAQSPRRGAARRPCREYGFT